MCSPRAPRRSRRSRSTRPWLADESSIRARNRPAGSQALVFALALAFFLPALLLAHELGTIRVSVRFQKDGTYIVDAIVDRQHLPPGFGASGSAIPKRFEPVENLTPELEKRIGPLIADAINGATITFGRKYPPPRGAPVPSRGGG